MNQPGWGWPGISGSGFFSPEFEEPWNDLWRTLKWSSWSWSSFSSASAPEVGKDEDGEGDGDERDTVANNLHYPGQVHLIMIMIMIIVMMIMIIVITRVTVIWRWRRGRPQKASTQCRPRSRWKNLSPRRSHPWKFWVSSLSLYAFRRKFLKILCSSQKVFLNFMLLAESFLKCHAPRRKFAFGTERSHELIWYDRPHIFDNYNLDCQF